MMASLDLDPERKRSNSGTDVESVPTLQPEQENEKGGSTGQGATDVAQDKTEYPKGIRLIFLLVATIFSVLLVALDQVSNCLSLSSPEATC